MKFSKRGDHLLENVSVPYFSCVKKKIDVCSAWN